MADRFACCRRRCTRIRALVEAFLRSGAAWRDAVVRIAASYEEALRAFTDSVRRRHLRLHGGSRDGLSLLREIRHKGYETPSSCSPAAGREVASRR